MSITGIASIPQIHLVDQLGEDWRSAPMVDIVDSLSGYYDLLGYPIEAEFWDDTCFGKAEAVALDIV